MRACASIVSLIVRLGAMILLVAFESGIVSVGGLQNRQLPPAAWPSARPTADALADALNEQFEEDQTFADMFDPTASAVQCAFGFEAAARTTSTGRSDRGCQVKSSRKAKKKKPVTHVFGRRPLHQVRPREGRGRDSRVPGGAAAARQLEMLQRVLQHVREDDGGGGGGPRGGGGRRGGRE
jgi:hypothetical protein